MNKNTIIAILVMLLWASCYPLIVLSAPYASPMLTAFFRAIFAGIFLIIIALVFARPFPKLLTDWLYIIGIGLTATTIGFWGMFYAGTLVSPGLATVLTNTQPIIAGVLGWYFLKERINFRSLIAILLGFTGIVIISLDSLASDNEQLLSGIFYISVAAFGIAISNLLLKKLANQVDILYAMGFQLLIGGIPLGVISVNQNDILVPQWGYTYIWILSVLAILGTALPFILWFWLMDKAPLYKLNVFSFLTPVFGLSIGMMYFSESLSAIQWIGVLAIALSIYFVTKTEPIKGSTIEYDDIHSDF